MDDLTEEELLAMPLHSWHMEHQYSVFRVPGGWIYDKGPNSSVSGATFVPEPEPMSDAPTGRKAIQVTTTAMPSVIVPEGVEFGYTFTVALCDDGTLWGLHDMGEHWKRLPPIPQEGAEEPTKPKPVVESILVWKWGPSHEHSMNQIARALKFREDDETYRVTVTREGATNE